MLLHIASLRTRQQVESSGMRLTVSQLSYGKVPAEAVLDGTAHPIEAVLTQDGRGMLPEWEREDPNALDTAIYYERWSTRGREAHGWLHADTRRILQAG